MVVYQITDKWIYTPSIPPRRDGGTAAIVNAGVRIQGLNGTRHAALYLSEQGIPIRIALRVLVRGRRRRRAPPQPPI